MAEILRLASIRAGMTALLLSSTAAATADDATIERTDISFGEAADIVTARVHIEAGEWALSGGMTGYDLPDRPGDSDAQRYVLARMRQRLDQGATVNTRSCVVARDIGAPAASFPGMDPASCRYRHFRMQGTLVDTTVECAPSASSRGLQMEMHASYAPTRIVLDARTTTMILLPDNETRPATVRTHFLWARLGSCT